MADVIQFGSKVKSRGAGIPLALREFIDGVIVPALVREYVAEKKLAESPCTSTFTVAHSPTMLHFSSEVPK